MIEIKNSWDFKDTTLQLDIRVMDSEIKYLNTQLAKALEHRAKLQAVCKHNHVAIGGQEMTCEVCGARIEQ